MRMSKPTYRKPSLQRQQTLATVTASTKSISQKIFKVPT